MRANAVPPARVRRAILGAKRDVADTSHLHKMSLVAFLAWVGLGADGLSSSAYGPEEAFLALWRGAGSFLPELNQSVGAAAAAAGVPFASNTSTPLLETMATEFPSSPASPYGAVMNR